MCVCVCVCVCVFVRVLGQERGGASDQPPAERERIQQRAASCREAAGRRRCLPRTHTVQPHLSGTVCVCVCVCAFYLSNLLHLFDILKWKFSLSSSLRSQSPKQKTAVRSPAWSRNPDLRAVKSQNKTDCCSNKSAGFVERRPVLKRLKSRWWEGTRSKRGGGQTLGRSPSSEGLSFEKLKIS